MSIRQQQILNELRNGRVSTFSLSARLNAPEASVRRDVGTLRAAGYVIEHSYFGYHLANEPTTAPAEVQ